jgi:hypothetical protein
MRVLAGWERGTEIEDSANAARVKVLDAALDHAAMHTRYLYYPGKFLHDLLCHLPIDLKIVLATEPIVNDAPGVGTRQVVLHVFLLPCQDYIQFSFAWQGVR